VAGIDTYTVLMLHCDGTNGSTSFPDSSQYGHVMTARNGASVNASQGQFGQSAEFDGSNNRIDTPDSADWDFGSGDFTIDFWYRPNDLGSDQTLIAQWNVAGGNGAWYVCHLGGGNIQFVYKDASAGQLFFNRAFNVNVNTWHHIAISREGSSVRLFVDGNKMGSTVTWSGTFASSPNLLSIGSFDGGGQEVNGQLDEIRISKGIARWNADFTPPTAPYSGGITYTDTPSGGLVLSGSNVLQPTYSPVPSGGLVLGGSAVVARTLGLTRSGGIVLGGSVVVAQVSSRTPSGGIVLGGSVKLGPVRLTVRLLSGGTEIANWQHVITGSQARVSWAQLQVPLPTASVIRVAVGKPKLTLRGKTFVVGFVYVSLVGKPKLVLRGKPVTATQPTSASVGKPSLRLKGKTFVLRETQRVTVGKPKLILRTKPIGRAGAAGLTPTVPKVLTLTPLACQDKNVLVPTAPKSTLLIPTAKRSL